MPFSAGRGAWCRPTRQCCRRVTPPGGAWRGDSRQIAKAFGGLRRAKAGRAGAPHPQGADGRAAALRAVARRKEDHEVGECSHAGLDAGARLGEGAHGTYGPARNEGHR
jgi:hypothetical protein